MQKEWEEEGRRGAIGFGGFMPGCVCVARLVVMAGEQARFGRGDIRGGRCDRREVNLGDLEGLFKDRKALPQVCERLRREVLEHPRGDGVVTSPASRAWCIGIDQSMVRERKAPGLAEAVRVGRSGRAGHRVNL